MDWKRQIKDYIAANPVKGVTNWEAAVHSAKRIDWQGSQRRIHKYTNCTTQSHSSMRVRTSLYSIPKRHFYPFGTPLHPLLPPSILQHPSATSTACVYALLEIVHSRSVHTLTEEALNDGKIQRSEECGKRSFVVDRMAGRHSIRSTQPGG